MEGVQACDLGGRIVRLVIGVGLAGLCGCGLAPGGQPAARTAQKPSVPVVISPPRPFRTAMLATGAVDHIAAAAGRSASDASPAEPRRFPGAPSGPLPVKPAGDGSGARSAAVEIGSMLRAYTHDFNRHDAVALAAHWSPTAENVDLDTGDVTRGRAAVGEVFSALFATEASGRLDIDVASIRMLRDDVAVVDAVAAVSFAAPADALAGSIAPTASNRRRMSAVVVRRDGQWLLESVREARVAEPATPAPQPLETLSWMVGTWEGATAGASVQTHCAWAADRRFLVRHHVVARTPPGAPAAGGNRGIPGLLLPGSGGDREVSEVIAFDSDRGQIRSWFFNSQGRFAEGTWARDGERFVVLVEGRGADTGSGCRCRIERIGPAECLITCDGDALLDVCPPACGFVRVD